MPIPIIWAFYNELFFVKNVQTVSPATLAANAIIVKPLAMKMKIPRINQIEEKRQLNMK